MLKEKGFVPSDSLIGKKRSEESMKKAREARKTKKVSEATKAKLKKINLGKTHGKEARKKISLRHRGEGNHAAKLTEEEVIEIRNKYSNSEISYSELGREYGVTLQAIYRIVKKINWKHI